MSLRILTLVTALWAGSLIMICAIVAPSLFAVISDRHLAGELAGYFFRVESWLSLAFGGIALVLLARSSAIKIKIDTTLLVVTAVAPVLNEIAVRPFMDRARTSGDTQTFGILHGVGATLFAIACATSLVLLWRISRPAT